MIGKKSAEKPCGAVFPNDAVGWRKHVRIHLQNSAACRIGTECDFTASSTRGYADQMIHLLEAHGLNPFATDQLVQWCWYCEAWVCFVPASPGAEAHYRQHMDSALQNVMQYGYGGCLALRRLMIPPACIFCIHKPDCASEDGLYTTDSTGNYQDHVWRHISAIDTLPAKRVPCPASALAEAEQGTCLSNELFTSAEIREHLESVHGIKLDEKYGGREDKRRARTKAAKAEKGAKTEGAKSKKSRSILDEISQNSPTKRRKFTQKSNGNRCCRSEAYCHMTGDVVQWASSLSRLHSNPASQEPSI